MGRGPEWEGGGVERGELGGVGGGSVHWGYCCTGEDYLVQD